MPKATEFIADTTGPDLVALDDIPQAVKDWVEEAYKYSRTHKGRIRAKYDTVDELKAEFKLMVSYARQRKAGVLSIRRSPTRNIPDEWMDVRVTADVPANGQKAGENQARTRA